MFKNITVKASYSRYVEKRGLAYVGISDCADFLKCVINTHRLKLLQMHSVIFTAVIVDVLKVEGGPLRLHLYSVQYRDQNFVLCH